MIREKPENLAEAFKLLTTLPEDFFSEGRQDTPPQKREFSKIPKLSVENWVEKEA